LRAPGCFELALWDSSQTTSVRNTFLAFAQIYSGQQWANAGTDCPYRNGLSPPAARSSMTILFSGKAAAGLGFGPVLVGACQV